MLVSTGRWPIPRSAWQKLLGPSGLPGDIYLLSHNIAVKEASYPEASSLLHEPEAVMITEGGLLVLDVVHVVGVVELGGGAPGRLAESRQLHTDHLLV